LKEIVSRNKRHWSSLHKLKVKVVKSASSRLCFIQKYWHIHKLTLSFIPRNYCNQATWRFLLTLGLQKKIKKTKEIRISKVARTLAIRRTSESRWSQSRLSSNSISSRLNKSSKYINTRMKIFKNNICHPRR